VAMAVATHVAISVAMSVAMSVATGLNEPCGCVYARKPHGSRNRRPSVYIFGPEHRLRADFCGVLAVVYTPGRQTTGDLEADLYTATA